MSARTIVVTGAGSGIGRATARLFLDNGWRVALVGRRADALTESAQADPQALILPCDVTDEAAVDAVFDTVLDRWGRIDVLFNNAGRNLGADTPDRIAPDDFRAVLDVNVTGVFLCARAAFARMRAQDPQGGRIINNGSISAHAPRPGTIAYTAAKHAVTGITRALSLDGRAFGIACGQIDIGNARTELLEGIIAANPGDAPPTMDVADVARAVLQMAALGPEANVQFMTILATKMPYIGRG